MNKVKKILKTLTSPQFHGRGYVNEGDKKAANYIRDEFKKMKVKAFEKDFFTKTSSNNANAGDELEKSLPPKKTNNDENYFQYFPLEVNTFPNKISLQIGRKKLKVGQEFIAFEAASSGKGKVKLFIFDSLAMKNKEKIKLLANIEPKKTMIVIEEKMESALEKLPQELLQKIYQCEAILEIVKGKKMVAHISKKPYTMPWFRITKQTWESLQTEINQNKENTDAIFELESVYLSNYITQNVVGYIEGTAVKDSFLVLTAHYDHLGRMGKNSYFPGANDNASGTSMVLSLADYFAKNPPKYSVAFILFSGEEVGLLGSEYFVKNPIIPLEKIKFLFNLDIVGTGDDGGTVVNSTIFKEDFERLNKINTEKKHLPKLATRGKAANSDHHYFTENGVKAFYIYTMGGIAYYHDVNDIADTLPLTKYQGVFRLLKDFFESF